MSVLSAGRQSVGLCVSRRLPRRAPAVAQRPGVVGPEGLTPRPDRLVRDGDPAFGEQILDVTEAQAKAVVEPVCVTDDLGRKAVAAVAWRRACHGPTLPATGSS